MSDWDGVWRPERQISGAWIATRYYIDRELQRSHVREVETEVRNGVPCPIYCDSLAQCEPRCDALNKANKP